MKVTHVKIFTFDELSEKVQESVVNNLTPYLYEMNCDDTRENIYEEIQSKLKENGYDVDRKSLKWDLDRDSYIHWSKAEIDIAKVLPRVAPIYANLVDTISIYGGYTGNELSDVLVEANEDDIDNDILEDINSMVYVDFQSIEEALIKECKEWTDNDYPDEDTVKDYCNSNGLFFMCDGTKFNPGWCKL